MGLDLAVLRWRLTHNRVTRAVRRALVARGVRAAKLDRYSLPGGRAPPERALDGVTFEALPADTADPAERPDDADPGSGDRVVFARVDGEVVGTVVASDRPVRVETVGRRFHGEGAYLWGLHVAPGHRRRGIGTALVGQAVLAARKAFDRGRASALVAVGNVPARRAFAANGFEPRERLTYYRLGSREHRATRTL